VELPDETFEARASGASGEARQRLFDAPAALMPNFKGYAARPDRAIPVVVLEPVR